MATQKQTPVVKMALAAKNLPIVSKKLGEIQRLASLTDNDEAKDFILAQTERYQADVLYLRRSGTYQLQKIAEGMSVETFSKFLHDLTEVAKKYSA